MLAGGDTVDDRQNRLMAVCSAWNIACAPAELRQRQLKQYVEGYLIYNPGTNRTDLASITKDMELLIERKLEMFPDDQRQIVDARVVKIGSDYRIEVAAAALR